jgi:type I restriction enzyme S subunit
MTDATRNLLEQHFDTAFAAPDGVAKLRELILTLAMQGKLVEQNPNEPPASELLKEIEKEKVSREGAKARRGKEKKLPPIKPEEMPYELPQGWEWVRLGEVTNIIRGITFPASEKTREPAPNRIACLRTTNVQNNIEWDDLLYIDSKYMKKDEQVIEKNDIVMSMANSRELVGKVAIINEIPIESSTFGGFLGVIRTYLIDARYLLSILRTTYSRKSLIDSASQTTNIANISLGKLNPFLIPLPPIPEQHRIVARIDQLMTRCDELEKLRKEREEKRLAVHAAAIKQLLDAPDGSAWEFIEQHFGELYTVKENVAELRKAILQLAVMGRLVPQDPNDPPASELLKEIEAEKQRLVKAGKIKQPKPLPPIKPEEVSFGLPRGWEWVRTGEVGEIKLGRQRSPKDHTGPYMTPYLRVANVHDNRIDLSDVKEMNFTPEEQEVFRLDFGDILLNEGQSKELVGRPAKYRNEVPGACFQNTLLRFRAYGGVSPDYALLYFRHCLYSGRFQRAVKQTTNMAHLSAGRLIPIEFPLPPTKQQECIVIKVDQLMSLCDTLDHQIDAVTSKQTKLLNAVMAQA